MATDCARMRKQGTLIQGQAGRLSKTGDERRVKGSFRFIIQQSKGKGERRFREGNLCEI
jgi:hypothetical protein